jgi:hypothetical protein
MQSRGANLDDITIIDETPKMTPIAVFLLGKNKIDLPNQEQGGLLFLIKK